MGVGYNITLSVPEKYSRFGVIDQPAEMQIIEQMIPELFAYVNLSVDEGAPADDDELSGIHCRLDELLAERGMTLARLSELVGVSVVNLSILKNDRARAIRYSTLSAICRVLDCEVGELLVRAD